MAMNRISRVWFPMSERWRCLQVGCNPRLDESSAVVHRSVSGHRVALWPVRSAEGRRRARERNKSGYYDRYNVGEKSAAARGIGAVGRRYEGDEFTLSGEDFAWD